MEPPRTEERVAEKATTHPVRLSSIAAKAADSFPSWTRKMI